MVYNNDRKKSFSIAFKGRKNHQMDTTQKGHIEKQTHLRFLSQKTLENLQLTSKTVVKSIEYLIRGYRQSQVWNAPKAVVTPPNGRYMMATLSASDDPPFLAVKSLLLNPLNSQRGYKNINALVVLHDSDNGLPLAVIDGNWVTAIRTAGLSAVAAKRLAKPDASILALIGCGVQAHSHLHTFAELFPLKEIRAFGRGTANRDALCQTAKEMGFTAVASNTAQDAVCDADLVISTVTISPQLIPFMDARWLKPGAFATLTDLATPWHADSLTTFDRIIIDDLAQEAKMQQPLVKPSMVSGDLTGLVNGDILGRCNNNERTAFVFRGLALGDLAVAALAYQAACKLSQGTLIEI